MDSPFEGICPNGPNLVREPVLPEGPIPNTMTKYHSPLQNVGGGSSSRKSLQGQREREGQIFPRIREEVIVPSISLQEGEQEFSLDRAIDAHHLQFPHGKSLVHLVPSAGHKPPSGEVFPAATQPSLVHVESSEVEEADLPNPELHLPEGMSPMEKWLWLNQENPDFIAADIAVNGFKIYWEDPSVTPPLIYVRDAIHSPNIPHTSRNQEDRLSIIVDDWEERAIVTSDLHKIPTHAHFSRLFGVVKDRTEIRPVIDLSLLNLYLKCPDLKMETLEKLLDLVQDPMWAAIIDVQDAFLSVKIALEFQKFFCFILKKSLHVSKDAFRVVPSSLDLFKVNENNKEISETQRSQYKLFHRRLHCMGNRVGLI